MQEEAREEVWWLSARGRLLPPHSSRRAWRLAARFLEFISASRSGAAGWARPASPAGRSSLLSGEAGSLVCGLVQLGVARPASSRRLPAHSGPMGPTRCENSTLFLWQLALSVQGSRWNGRGDPQGQSRSPAFGVLATGGVSAVSRPMLTLSAGPGTAGRSRWPMPLGWPGQRWKQCPVPRARSGSSHRPGAHCSQRAWGCPSSTPTPISPPRRVIRWASPCHWALPLA